MNPVFLLISPPDRGGARPGDGLLPGEPRGRRRGRRQRDRRPLEAVPVVQVRLRRVHQRHGQVGQEEGQGRGGWGADDGEENMELHCLDLCGQPIYEPSLPQKWITLVLLKVYKLFLKPLSLPQVADRDFGFCNYTWNV